MLPEVSSNFQWLIRHASSGSATVSRKVSLALTPLVLATVMVMRPLPVRPGAGVMVTVRLEPPPPRTMPAFGTSDWSEELAKSVSAFAGVAGSPTVKGIGAVGVPGGVV